MNEYIIALYIMKPNSSIPDIIYLAAESAYQQLPAPVTVCGMHYITTINLLNCHTMYIVRSID